LEDRVCGLLGNIRTGWKGGIRKAGLVINTEKGKEQFTGRGWSGGRPAPEGI